MAAAAPAQPVDVSLDSSIRARAMALLFLAGGTIGALSLVLPHAAKANEAALWSNIALAWVAGAALLAIGARLPSWAFHLSLAVGAVLVTRAILVSGEVNSFYSV